MTAAFWVSVATDNAVHRLRDLDLDPLRAAAFFVKAIAAFRQDPFQSLLPRGGQELHPMIKMLGVTDRPTRNDQAGKGCLALLERNTPQVVAVKIEQVECVVENGDITASRPCDGRYCGFQYAAASG